MPQNGIKTEVALFNVKVRLSVTQSVTQSVSVSPLLDLTLMVDTQP
jgi:hypothetical protein